MKKRFLFLIVAGLFVMVPLAYALFSNGGFQDGTFSGWTVEHGYNNGLTISSGVPVAENIVTESSTPGWQSGGWTDNDYYTFLPRAYITSGTDNDYIATMLPTVKYGLYSARVNSHDWNAHASRIYQEATLSAGDRDTADGRFHVRFAWAAVLEDPGHPADAQPYFHITLKKVADDTVLYSQFFYSGQPGITWRTDNVSQSGWVWVDWQEVDLDITDNVAVGDTLRIELSAADCSWGGHGGTAYLDGFRTQASPVEGPPAASSSAFSLSDDGLGNGWCGVVFDAGGKGGSGPGPWGGAAVLTLYFALFLLPVWILKRLHGSKRTLARPALLSLLLAGALMLAATADAAHLAPKAQRFHPTTDGQGAITLDSDATLGTGKYAFVGTANLSKRPLNRGEIADLRVTGEVVHDLLTVDLAGAYGISPNFEVGLDVPVNFLINGIDVNDLNAGRSGEQSDVSVGDIRLNAKWRFLRAERYGLAVVPFANFATGNDDFLLSEGKFGYGAKLAGHCDAVRKVSFFANLGVEFIGDPTRSSDSPKHRSPWIQYGVGATYRLDPKKALVAEINSETIWDKPFSHTTVTPVELLAAWRQSLASGLVVEIGGGGGLNKGIGAPQWRAFVGATYLR